MHPQPRGVTITELKIFISLWVSRRVKYILVTNGGRAAAIGDAALLWKNG